MNTGELADRFVQALHALEVNRDIKPIADLFAPDAVLFNPMLTEGVTGRQAIERFWRQYRETFNTVESRFRRKLVCGDVAVLEWYTDANLVTDHRPVHYSGVTILEHDGHAIKEFKTYYDTASLTLSKGMPWRPAGQGKRPGLSHGHGPETGR